MHLAQFLDFPLDCAELGTLGIPLLFPLPLTLLEMVLFPCQWLGLLPLCLKLSSWRQA